MKSLKITVLAIFSIALLAGFTSYKTIENNEAKSEVKKANIDLTAMKDKKGVKLPAQG